MKIEIIEMRTPSDEQTIQAWLDEEPQVTLKIVTVVGNYVYIFYEEV